MPTADAAVGELSLPVAESFPIGPSGSTEPATVPAPAAPAPGEAHRAPLWFERLFSRLGVGYVPGVVLIAALPPVAAHFVTSYLLGSLVPSSADWPLGLLDSIAYIPVPLLGLLGSSYVASRVAELCEHAAARGTAVDTDAALRRLASFRYVGFGMVPVVVVSIGVLAYDAARGSPTSDLALHSLDALITIETVLLLGTLVWVFAYSMYLIHRLAAGPMRSVSFAEDRFLGFRPFGVVAFRLTLVYLAAMAVLAIHVNLPPLPAPAELPVLSLFLLAVPLFLLPLWTLHRRQEAAKGRELEWVGRRYAAALSAIRAADPTDPTDPRAPGNGDYTTLAALRGVREDLERIPTWPFDIDVVARLVAVILTVSGILLSSVIRDVLNF